MKKTVFLLSIILCLAGLTAWAQDEEGTITGPVYVSDPVVPALTPAIRDLPDYVPDPNIFGMEMKRREDWGFTPVEYGHPPKVDPLAEIQRQAQKSFSEKTDAGFATLIHNFAGQASTSSPPDTTGDVGPNYFVQATNQSVSTVAFVNKTTGAFTTKTLASLASASPCSSGFCDPIVLYDRVADRWILSELPSADASVCVYVSQTSDPTGAYYAYNFAVDSSVDYPKYGVWPQNGNGGSYLVGLNASHTAGYWDLCAFDRAKMLAGQAATYQEFSVPYLANAGFQLVLPSHMEGSIPPPNGEPAIFARPHDDENADSPAGSTSYDWIDLWALSVNWTTPASSTLTKLTNVQISDYDMTLCGMGSTWNCMPQPGTTQKIDPIREPLHWPLHYRNFSDYQSLVGTFVEDFDGTDHAALRWFELRKPESGGSWTLYQEGVLGGEANIHHSVGSISMDKMGNIAIGYTRTGTTAPYYPSILYSGRQVTDTLGTMPNYDLTIQAGAYSKTGDERWGDYSGMAVDPSDDCTFWYTTEYMTSASNCGTRVAAFEFGSCITVNPVSATLADSCASGGAGNGNGIIDPGETITFDPTLQNLSYVTPLSGLSATLSTTTSGVTVSGSTAAYANMAVRASGASGAPHFTFTVDPAVALGTVITLNLHLTAASGGPWDIPYTYTVGQCVGGTNVTATQVTTPLTATNSTATSTFTPAFTATAADSGTLSYTYAYMGAPSTLFGPDDMAAYATNWTSSGTVSTQTATHCSHSTSYTRLAGATGGGASITLTNAVSTVGLTNIQVTFDYAVSATTSSTALRLDWSANNGSTWTTGAFSGGTTTWGCGNTVTLPAGAAGVSQLKIRFANAGTSTTRYAYVDYVSITGTPTSSSGSWTANARVSLVSPSSTVTVLKPYGTADANPYDVHSYYTGAGTYSVRVEENTGNTASITAATLHVVQNAICTGNTCSAGSPPGAPSITGISDVSACAASGVTISYTAGSGATSHNLFKDASLVVTGFPTGTTYTPGDTTTHTYVIQAHNTYGNTSSTGVAGTDANNTPGAPSITGITDNNVCVQDGVKVSFTAGSGAASHNLLKDNTVVVTGYTSGAVYNPGDTATHTYTVRAVNGACTTDSGTSTFADAVNSCTPPVETAPGSSSSNSQTWDSGKATQSWPSVSGATYYTLYRGTSAQLSNLLNAGTDSCTVYSGASLSASDASSPAAGQLYWYLVTAGNSYGEGPAGNATAGARIVNSSGNCP